MPWTSASRAATGSAAQALVDMAAQNRKAPVTTRKPARSGREAKRPRRAREDLGFIFETVQSRIHGSQASRYTMQRRDGSLQGIRRRMRAGRGGGSLLAPG